jgi:hypothetical protein
MSTSRFGYHGGVAEAKLTLELHLVLHDERLALVVNLLGELGRDGVVRGRVLDNEALVAVDALVLVGLLDRPLADVGPFLLCVLVGAAGVLLGVGRLPPGLPVVGELLEEVRLDGGGLSDWWELSAAVHDIPSSKKLAPSWSQAPTFGSFSKDEREGKLTVKVGSSGTALDSSTSSAYATPASRAAAAATVLNFMAKEEASQSSTFCSSKMQRGRRRKKKGILAGVFSGRKKT